MRRRSSGGGALGCFFIILFLNLVLGGLATEYVLETWLTYLKETLIDIPFWPCAIAGLFIGEITIPLAIFTWIIFLVL